MTSTEEKLRILGASLEGELFYDKAMRALYATDASVYREMPMAVAFPRHKEDIQQLIHFARKEKCSLIPRAAGTSLAGQCVGSGIVVDVSKYFSRILEVNPEEQWVRVEPGVIRDDLNHHLRPHGLFFGPNTSTANRAMIGGMVGNNSCGSYSLVYGTTRDHVLSLNVLLSDGSEIEVKALTEKEFEAKLRRTDLEGKIYQHIHAELSDSSVQSEIREHFPKKDIHRRNTGYAVDELLKFQPFHPKGEPFNFCSLLTGSEGTLAFTTEIKIHVDPLPPPVLGLLCIHFHSVEESLKAVVAAVSHAPRAVELMDKIVMDCTKENLLYRNHRFFIEGDPEAVLVIEAGGDTQEEVEKQLNKIQKDIKRCGWGYAFPRVWGADIKKVWNLRKAGLGLLANVPGDAKPVAVIEDTAVAVKDLPNYISEFSEIMDRYGQRAVYYAHAGAGELHLRPILDLKKREDVVMFRSIGQSTAELVKKYQGSLSGEHGDGRVRAEFIPLMVGEKNYELFRRIKHTWDPHNLFNPGKIVDAPPMDTSLRYEPGQETPSFETMFDFSETEGILRAAEKCNGSGDCRKSHLSGGTMCPSYMASRNEKDTTRARANILREFLTRSDRTNPFSHEEIYEVMDLCLSCKGCTSECPSNVDMSTLKAEFLYQYYQTHGIPLRTRAIAHIGRIQRSASRLPWLHNGLIRSFLTAPLLKAVLKIAPARTLPTLYKTTLRKWFEQNRGELQEIWQRVGVKQTVYLFADEFTNFNDVEIGITAIQLLAHLGYEVEIPKHVDSGRAYISKGMLVQAQQLASKNVALLSKILEEDAPLLGIEPSGILSFRDEYPRLVPKSLRSKATQLAARTWMVDEFLAREMEAGTLSAEQFTTDSKEILLHGHCHQKALSSTASTRQLLSLPENYHVSEIPSGCCGMAGSFGYEKEHYEMSMKVGELVLFPTVRDSHSDTLVVAPGTSCRHQIWDGAQRKAMHPVEVLWEALKK